MKRASGVGHLTPFLPGLDTLLEDPEASEIMINGPRNVWVERRGRLEAHEAPKLSSAWLHRAAIHIARPLGLDPAARPILDARLGDGSRVAICTPPAAPEVAITIRRFGGRAFSADDLVRLGSLPEPVLQTAQTTLASRRNILVSVGTGSGKTTLLNALIELLPEDERIVAIEDTLELRIDRANCLRFEAGATLSESRTGPPFRRATQPRELPNAERPSSRIRREPGRRIHLLPRTLRASVRRHRRLRRRLVPRPRQSPLRRPSLYDPTGRERLDPEGARPGDPATAPKGNPFKVLTLSRKGVADARKLAAEHGMHPRQEIRFARTRPSEAAHDTTLYRACRKERQRLEAQGATVRRIRLGTQLKSAVARGSEAVRRKDGKRAADAERHRIAQELGLPIEPQGRVLYPDAQIEYTDADGRSGRVNIEAVSGNYREGPVRAKAAAGFTLHANGPAAVSTPQQARPGRRRRRLLAPGTRRPRPRRRRTLTTRRIQRCSPGRSAGDLPPPSPGRPSCSADPASNTSRRSGR